LHLFIAPLQCLEEKGEFPKVVGEAVLQKPSSF
jgi:hypothetical protein